MKIAFVLPGSGGGGVRSVVRIADGLIARGHDVLLLYRAPRRMARDLLRSAYLRVRYGRRQNWLAAFTGRTQSYEILTPQLVGCHDVVVGVGVDCVLALSELPASCGIKVHNSRGVEPWIEDRMTRAWRLPMPRIVVGRHLVEAMRRHGSSDPIFVAHNGVDRSEYYPAVPEEARLGVGTVYHGAAVKDPETLLAALNQIHLAQPTVPLYVFGGHPRPRGLPQSARYTRLPHLAAARECYSRSLVWFCASRDEGLPNPLLEAMACGCAVVSTDCGGPADIIQSGVNGWLVPVGRPDELAARVIRLLREPALRANFQAAAQATLAQFTWSSAIHRWEAALAPILAAPVPSANCRSHPVVRAMPW